MFCPQCGHKNLPEAKFCLECGTAIKPAPEESTAQADAGGGLKTPDGTTEDAGGARKGPDGPVADAGGSQKATNRAAAAADSLKSQPVSLSKENASDRPLGTSISAPPAQARKPVGTGIWLYLGLGCLGIVILIIVFVIGIMVISKKLAADQAGRTTVTATPGDGRVTAPHPAATSGSRKAIMCKNLTSNMGPDEKSDVFSPTDIFYCSVNIKGLKKGTVVTAKWYKGETFIKEYPCEINVSNAAYIGFSLKPPPTKWPAGDDYRVEIFVDDTPSEEASFRVEDGGESSSSETEMDPALKNCLKSSTLCRDVDDDYNPVDETDVFGRNDTFNCLVVVENAPANTVVKARWYHGEDMMDEKEYPIKDGGDKTVNLYCKKKTAWTPGDYSVELSLNNHPVEVKKLTVTDEESSE